MSMIRRWEAEQSRLLTAGAPECVKEQLRTNSRWQRLLSRRQAETEQAATPPPARGA